METTLQALFSALLAKGVTLTILAVVAYVFYKKDDQRRAQDMKERADMQQRIVDQEKRFEQYIENGHAEMITVIKNNTITYKQSTEAFERVGKLMTCVINEIQDFKQSEIYKSHEAAKPARKRATKKAA